MMAGGGSSASAAVVRVTPVQPVLAAAGQHDLTFELQEVDFNGDGTPEFQVLATPGGVDLYLSASARIFIVSSPPPNLGGLVANLDANVTLGADTGNAGFRWYGGSLHTIHDLYPGILEKRVTLALTGTDGNHTHFAGLSGYFGVGFELESGTHYGWVRLSESETYGIGGVITGWAYETRPGVPVVTGIPESSVLPALGLGGLLGGRRRKA
jgi:hypothetical protein